MNEDANGEMTLRETIAGLIERTRFEGSVHLTSRGLMS